MGVVIFLLLACWAQAATAFTIPGFFDEPGVSPDRKHSTDTNINESIDPLSGMLRLFNTDIVTPGNGGFDIQVTRTYHSQFDLPTILGYGWGLHFGRILWPENENVCGLGQVSSANNPVLQLPDGSRQVLLETSTGFAGENHDYITRQFWVADCTPSGIEFISSEGITYFFDYTVAGHLEIGSSANSMLVTRIEDLNGNWIEFEYGDGNFPGWGLIHQITSKDGRTFDFEYYPSTTVRPYLKKITAPGGAEWVFTYKQLPNHASGFQVLEHVDGPANLTREYHYYEVATPPADPNFKRLKSHHTIRC